jgi:hypothetical protein
MDHLKGSSDVTDIATELDRPNPLDHIAKLEAADRWIAERVELKVYCAKCSTRVGLVYETPHGSLWVGFLGSNRRGRKIRRGFYAEAGYDFDGRQPVAMWIEKWRPYYLCDCKCLRNSADAAVIHAALLARQRKVDVPAQS